MLINVFDQIKNNPMTAVGARYSKQDVLRIWKELARQIVEILKEGKGMVIKSLGTFSLSNWSLETGNNNRTLDFWRPVFFISTALKEDFDLHQPKQYVNDAIPLAPIKYHGLAKACNLTKEQAIGCIEEATQCFRRLVSEGKTVKFPLEPLGDLIISDTYVQFTFVEQCRRTKPEKPQPCAKFSTAYVPYTRKFTVPCEGHSKNHF